MNHDPLSIFELFFHLLKTGCPVKIITDIGGHIAPCHEKIVDRSFAFHVCFISQFPAAKYGLFRSIADDRWVAGCTTGL